MKKVLSLLVVFVFLQVQTWALSGGPDFGASGSSIVGTYSGTLVGNIPPSNAPSTVTTTTTNTTQTPPAAPVTTITTNTTSTTNTAAAPAGAGLGIFTLSVPTNGIGSGVFALFVGGSVFVGRSAAVADPGKRQIDGILTGQFTTTSSAVGTGIGGGSIAFSNPVSTMGAQFTAKVQAGGGRRGGLGGTRLNGTALASTRTTSAGGAVTFQNFSLTVSGFQQSTNPDSSTADLSSLTLGGTNS